MPRAARGHLDLEFFKTSEDESLSQSRATRSRLLLGWRWRLSFDHPNEIHNSRWYMPFGHVKKCCIKLQKYLCSKKYYYILYDTQSNVLHTSPKLNGQSWMHHLCLVLGQKQPLQTTYAPTRKKKAPNPIIYIHGTFGVKPIQPCLVLIGLLLSLSCECLPHHLLFWRGA